VKRRGAWLNDAGKRIPKADFHGSGEPPAGKELNCKEGFSTTGVVRGRNKLKGAKAKRGKFHGACKVKQKGRSSGEAFETKGEKVNPRQLRKALSQAKNNEGKEKSEKEGSCTRYLSRDTPARAN